MADDNRLAATVYDSAFAVHAQFACGPQALADVDGVAIGRMISVDHHATVLVDGQGSRIVRLQRDVQQRCGERRAGKQAHVGADPNGEKTCQLSFDSLDVEKGQERDTPYSRDYCACRFDGRVIVDAGRNDWGYSGNFPVARPWREILNRFCAVL